MKTVPALVLPFLLVLTLLGCATMEKKPLYRPSVIVGKGESYAHLSDGFTEDRIQRVISYPGKEQSDEIFFVTYGASLEKMPYSMQFVAAAYRGAELATEQGFTGVTFYRERPPFKAVSVTELGPIDSFKIEGRTSNDGNFSGSVTREMLKLEGNSDRAPFTAEARWGSGIYAVLSKKCTQPNNFSSQGEPSPYVFYGPELKYESRPREIYVNTERCFVAEDFKDSIAKVLSTYLEINTSK